MIRILGLAAVALLISAGAASACTDISSQTVTLTGCVDDEWQASEGEGAQEFVYLTADQNFGLMVITETEAVSAGQFGSAILNNAITGGAGGNADDVKVVGERIENIDGKPFNVLQYTLANDGSPILYQNFYYSQPGLGSIQILVFSLETDAVAAAYKAGVFTSTVKVGG